MQGINRVDFFQKNKIEPMTASASMEANAPQTASFKDTIANMISEMNEVINKPEQLTLDAIQGKADVHDVMAAVAQSELMVQTATTITGKILQTYEKIMQISI